MPRQTRSSHTGRTENHVEPANPTSARTTRSRGNSVTIHGRRVHFAKETATISPAKLDFAMKTNKSRPTTTSMSGGEHGITSSPSQSPIKLDTSPDKTPATPLTLNSKRKRQQTPRHPAKSRIGRNKISPISETHLRPKRQRLDMTPTTPNKPSARLTELSSPDSILDSVDKESSFPLEHIIHEGKATTTNPPHEFAFVLRSDKFIKTKSLVRLAELLEDLSDGLSCSIYRKGKD